MLAVHVTGLGQTASPELTTLRDRVTTCLKQRANLAFTETDAGAGASITCSALLDDSFGTAGISFQQLDKLSFIENIDNQLLFGIARDVIGKWRGMGVPTGKPDRNETKIRRIAATKLAEVGTLAPDSAILTLSAASREEADCNVQLAIINGLAQLISDTTAANIRTEAITSLKVIKDDPTFASCPDVRKAAEVALQIVDKPIPSPLPSPFPLPPPPTLHEEIGVKTRPKWVIPLVTLSVVAAAAGTVWYVRRRTHAQALGMGPLRRKVERSLQLRRRR